MKPARTARVPKYDADTVVALAFCWAVLGAPGKRLAAAMGELVPRVRRFGELQVTEEVTTALVSMSPATMDGYHRYDTAAELAMLNQIWVLQSQVTTYFLPQQKLVSKVRHGAKVTKKYDKATTPHRRAERHVP